MWYGIERQLIEQRQPTPQGLIVAGGLGSKLAGGSFELGFLTAGLAFAVNQILSEAERIRLLESTGLGGLGREIQKQTKEQLNGLKALINETQTNDPLYLRLLVRQHELRVIQTIGVLWEAGEVPNQVLETSSMMLPQRSFIQRMIGALGLLPPPTPGATLDVHVGCNPSCTLQITSTTTDGVVYETGR